MPKPIAGLQTLAPVVSSVFDCPVEPKIKAVLMTAPEARTIGWTVVDDAGLAVDCSGLIVNGVLPTVQVAFAEAVRAPFGGVTVPGTGSFADAAACAAGTVTAPVPAAVAQGPGVYQVDIGVVDTLGNMTLVNSHRLIVQRSLLNPTTQAFVMPTVRELRARLRDSSASESVRLGAIEFDLAEVALALEFAPRLWNELPPPISQTFDTKSFPFQDMWLNLTIATLYQTGAHWMRRQRLPVQAGGTTVDDLGKADEYEKQAQAMFQTETERLLAAKVRMNCESCFTSSSGGIWAFDGW